MILAMIPGDARQEALADLLRADGHKTPVYSPGLEADWIIFPLPTAAHPLLGTLRPGSQVLAGGAAGRWPDLHLRDYYDSEAVQVLNAVKCLIGFVLVRRGDWATNLVANVVRS